MKKQILFIVLVTFSLTLCNAQSLNSLSKSVTSTSKETQMETLFNQPETQKQIAANLHKSSELSNEAIKYLKNNPDTKAEVTKVITQNPTSKQKIMNYITQNPQLISKVMDYFKTKPELMEKALKLVGM